MCQRKHLPLQGFSLLECAIALVIVGVLVGGVLAGKNLLRAAELRALGTQAKQYMAASSLFKTKYQALPGDMRDATAVWGAAHANPNTCLTTNSLTLVDPKKTCNGNRKIDLSLGGGEFFRFWQHLANEGLIAGPFSGVDGDTSTLLL
jgi:prepilin-type N-terminal cleavage/methylation domain-containing protein